MTNLKTVSAKASSSKHKTTAGDPAYGRGGKTSKILSPEGIGIFVRKSLQVLVKAAEHFGFDSTGVKMVGTFNHHVKCALLIGDPIKYMKYKLSAYFAANMSDGLELPVQPEVLKGVDSIPGEIFGGKLYHWIHMKFQDPEWRRAWCTTVLYSKGGMPRPDSDYVKFKSAEAFKKLTDPVVQPKVSILDPKIEWGDDDEWGERRFAPSLARVSPSIHLGLVTRDDLCGQISRTAHELFSGNPYTKERQNRPFFPSTSANYINTRSRGGAVGFLKDQMATVFEQIKQFAPGSPNVQFNRYYPSLTRVRNVFSSRGSTMVSSYPVMDDSVLRMRWEKFIDQVGFRAMSEVPVAKILGLSEALKVRPITMSPAYMNTYLKPLQMHMWNIMHNHPAFILTGTPVTEWIIQDRIGSRLREDQQFVSVDYEDATNGLYSDYSNCAVDAICDALEIQDEQVIKLRELFKRSLTGHIIESADGPTGRGVQKPQTRGQLMGSITSFVILCVINAAILRWVKELDDNRAYTLQDSGILVNGDDGLLKLRPQGFRYWQSVSAFCGLKPSVGKVYQSNVFCNINSSNFVYDRLGLNANYVRDDGTEITRRLHFRRTPFLRMSLYYGLQRSSGVGSSRSPISSLGAQSRDLIAGCPSHIRPSVLRGWMSNHVKDLQGTRVPYFVPEWLGGLGLPVLRESSDALFHTSDVWRRVARKIHDHPESFRPPAAPPTVGWQTWSLARAAASAAGVFQTTLEARLASEMSSDAVPPRFARADGSALTNALVIDAFLSKPLQELYPKNPHKLGCPSARDTAMAVIKGRPREVFPKQLLNRYYEKWSKLWSGALRDKRFSLPEPYAEDRYPGPPVKSRGIVLMDTFSLNLQTKLPDEYLSKTEIVPFSFDSSVRAAQLLHDDDWW